MVSELVVLGEKIEDERVINVYNDILSKPGIERISFEDIKTRRDPMSRNLGGLTVIEDDGLLIYLKNIESELLAHEMIEGSLWFEGFPMVKPRDDLDSDTKENYNELASLITSLVCHRPMFPRKVEYGFPMVSEINQITKNLRFSIEKLDRTRQLWRGAFFVVAELYFVDESRLNSLRSIYDRALNEKASIFDASLALTNPIKRYDCDTPAGCKQAMEEIIKVCERGHLLPDDVLIVSQISD